MSSLREEHEESQPAQGAAPPTPHATLQNVRHFINPMGVAAHPGNPMFPNNPGRQFNVMQPVIPASLPVNDGLVRVRGVKPYQPPPTGSAGMQAQVQQQVQVPPQAQMQAQAQAHAHAQVQHMIGTRGTVPQSVPIVSPVDHNQMVKITTRAVSPVPHPLMNAGPHPLMGTVPQPTPDSGSIFSTPTVNKPDRFVIMVGNSAHHENERVMPIWDAYKKEVMDNTLSAPVIIRQYDMNDEPETINTLRQKLDLNPIAGPSIFRVDLSSGQPRVMRFMSPVTVPNLRDFSQF